MRVTRYLLRPESPWATPWHADSLFGALCWAYRDAAGNGELERLIEQFKNGQPPFVLSDAFPADLLPFPVGIEFEEPADRKLKALWVTVAQFREFAAGRMGKLPIAKTSLRGEARAQASRDRETDRPLDGALFEIDMESFDEKAEDKRLALYVAATEEGDRVFRQALAVLASTGFGRKASSGPGAFRVESAQACPWLEASSEANAFVSLSHFVPAADDPSDGAWRLHTTYPKFQGNQVREFLKGSLTMMTPGSWFRTNGAPNTWYGRVIPMPRDGLEKAVHYAMCLAAPVCLKVQAYHGGNSLPTR
jgi:CRISPR-associated protein Csm4